MSHFYTKDVDKYVYVYIYIYHYIYMIHDVLYDIQIYVYTPYDMYTYIIVVPLDVHVLRNMLPVYMFPVLRVNIPAYSF